MKRLILILFVLMIMAPMTTAMAARGHTRYERDYYYEPENYATIKLGAFMPHDDADVLDNGFAIGGAIGHYLNRNFAVEVGMDYTSTDFDYGYGYEDADVHTLGIPVTAKFIVPLSNQVEFFIGGGLGLYFTEIEFGHDDYYDDDRADETNIGFHCLVGADIKMNPNTALTMELKYTEVEQDFDDEYYYNEDFEVGGTTASVGVKFLF
jgi:opacity protein-like surface antigen